MVEMILVVLKVQFVHPRDIKTFFYTFLHFKRRFIFKEKLL
jgi:hypothetical protein